jgi:hypothetical protein
LPPSEARRHPPHPPATSEFPRRTGLRSGQRLRGTDPYHSARRLSGQDANSRKCDKRLSRLRKRISYLDNQSIRAHPSSHAVVLIGESLSAGPSRCDRLRPVLTFQNPNEKLETHYCDRFVTFARDMQNRSLLAQGSIRFN